MTPAPPRSRCAAPAGNGLNTSNTRKSRKPATSAAGAAGAASTESIMPATSSTTIAPGSLPPSARSASSAAQKPSTVTTTSAHARETTERPRNQRASAVRALATVPGASGARPTPPTVAMATASRVRRARLGALADELVAVDLDHAHAGKVAGTELPPAAQVDDAVDLGRLARGPAFPVECVILAGAVDQHVGERAHELARALPGDGVLGFLHPGGALSCHLGVDLIGVGGRGGPLFRRVGEDAEPVEAHRVDEFEQPLERGLRLAGEADQHRRAHRDAGHRRAELGDDLAHAARGDRAPH